MPKLKTHKATAKKVKISRGKKRTIMTKKAGQNHFNAREAGRVTRAKRRNQGVAKVDEKNIRQQLPYS